MAAVTDHPLYAALYDRMCASAEAGGLSDLRRGLLVGARGKVLEVGGGTGSNLAHYGAAESVMVLEPDGAMRRKLQARLGECPVPVEVMAAGIDEADLASAAFDTIVCTLVLCTVPDLDRALRRIRTLLAPGGRLLFLEHTAAPGGWGIAQRLADPLWHRLVPGCHLDRDPITGLRRAGLLVADYDRIPLPLVPGLLDAGVLGFAMEPAVPPPVPVGTYPQPLARRVGPVRRRMARLRPVGDRS